MTTEPIVLVVGGTGRTGQRVLRRLLDRGARVRAIVRSAGKLAPELRVHPRLELSVGSLLARSDAELVDLVRGASAVVSCLGHVISLRGIYGAPRDLVAQATRRLCGAIEASQPSAPVRFVLMSSVSVHRPAPLDVRRGGLERGLLAILRAVVPPAKDNQAAADFLAGLGAEHPAIEWVVVRPDTLEEGEVSSYVVHESLVASLASPDHTRMANVADFLVELATSSTVWAAWRGKMPVVVDAPHAPLAPAGGGGKSP